MADNACSRLEGFLFTVALPDGERREVRLHGSGGELGGGCLCAANKLIGSPRRGEYVQRVLIEVLAHAQVEAEESGSVRVLDPEADWTTRIQPLTVSAVESVRPLWWG